MAQVNARVLSAARRFVRDVQKSGIRLHGAYLYGSYATGRAHRDSDIDVALVSPDFSGWVDDFDKMEDAILAMDPRIEFVHFPPDAFVDENPLAWEVKTKGVSLLPNERARKKPKRISPRRGRGAHPSRKNSSHISSRR